MYKLLIHTKMILPLHHHQVTVELSIRESVGPASSIFLVVSVFPVPFSFKPFSHFACSSSSTCVDIVGVFHVELVLVGVFISYPVELVPNFVQKYLFNQRSFFCFWTSLP